MGLNLVDQIRSTFSALPDCRKQGNMLYEWVADFTRTGEVQTLEKSRWNGKQRLTERYRYINQVPLRDSNDA